MAINFAARTRRLTNTQQRIMACLSATGGATAGDIVRRFYPHSKQPAKKGRTMLFHLGVLERRGLVFSNINLEADTALVWFTKEPR